jgi:hypothetical protein
MYELLKLGNAKLEFKAIKHNTWRRYDGKSLPKLYGC